jgi:hypothetical protein
MNSRRMAPARCPKCSAVHDAATSIAEEDATPTPGGYTLCFICGELLVFDEGAALRLPTLAERFDLERSPLWGRVRKAQRLIQSKDFLPPGYRDNG